MSRSGPWAEHPELERDSWALAYTHAHSVSALWMLWDLLSQPPAALTSSHDGLYLWPVSWNKLLPLPLWGFLFVCFFGMVFVHWTCKWFLAGRKKNNLKIVTFARYCSVIPIISAVLEVETGGSGAQDSHNYEQDQSLGKKILNCI